MQFLCVSFFFLFILFLFISFFFFFLFILFITTLKDPEAAKITPFVFDSKFPPTGHDF